MNRSLLAEWKHRLQVRLPLIRSFGFLLMGTVLARLLSAVALVLLARQLGPEEYGLFAAVFTVAWLTSPLFAWGLDNWLVGPGARGPWDLFISHAWTCVILKGLGGILWLTGLFLLALLANRPSFPAWLLLPVGGAVWMEEIQRSVQATFKARLKNLHNLLLMPLGQFFVVFAIGILMWQGVNDLTVFAVAWFGASVVATFAALYIFVQHLGRPGSLQGVRDILGQSLPFALSSGLAMLYGRVDVALVAALLGAGAAGLYSPAVSLVNALALIPTTMYFILLPLFNQARLQHAEALERVARMALWLGVGGGLLLGGLLLAAAPRLVQFLYGPAFEATGHVLAILGGVLMARTVSLNLAAGLVALDYQARRVVVQILAACFNVVVNLWVLQRGGGIYEVAWVFVCTEFFLALGYGWLFRRAAGRYLLVQGA